MLIDTQLETITYNVYDKISLENTINLINAKMAEV